MLFYRKRRLAAMLTRPWSVSLGPEPWPCFLCAPDAQFSDEAPEYALADQMPLMIPFSPR